MGYHYVLDAAQLLENCLKELQQVIQAGEKSHQCHYRLYDLRQVLALTERLLYEHVVVLLEQYSFKVGSSEAQTLYSTSNTQEYCLASCVDILRSVVERRRCEKQVGVNEGDLGSHKSHSFYPKRNATDSLLFRLIVALQLCHVRIGDARLVITGRRENHQAVPSYSSIVQTPLLAAGCCVAALVAVSYKSRIARIDKSSSILLSAQAGLALVSAHWLKRLWGNAWMTAKIAKSMTEIENWNQQWHVVQSTPDTKHKNGSSLDAAKSRRLIDFALQNDTPKASRNGGRHSSACTRRLYSFLLESSPRLTPYMFEISISKFSLWQSQGELRFLMLKRAMDVFYASVGTAMKVTSGTTLESDDATNWQVTLATAAVASFYTLTGARRMAEDVTSSSDTARSLIHHAWGMVSLPALKTISLQASRLVKGAAVADRIEIAGVPCFVLSREPAPELAAATKRYHRTHYRSKATSIHTLSTIDEQEELAPESAPSTKPFARSCTRYRQRDVILHLTGGGFFAHIIASDLPYLLDWSASTGAVVICPEYVLLPRHKFPDALRQVEAVYKELLTEKAVHALGFEASRIVLTGESAGGNLAAALCVKLLMDADGTPTCLSTLESQKAPNVEESLDHRLAENGKRTVDPILPCALVLSCPVLNLSLELSHSRVVGNQDPVLPSGLLSAISDAYLPRELGISKKDPLASPFYATDSILSRFPPTLVFASSNDPLLDDSVVLNQRLRSLGVESDLRAAHNLPHAYLGLGTAGFPEAQEVQRQLIDWLNFQLTREPLMSG